MATANKLLSPAELAEAFGISIETVYAWTSQKKIPYIKMGKLVRFSRNEVNRWLGDKQVDMYKQGDRGNDCSDTSFLRLSHSVLAIGGRV